MSKMGTNSWRGGKARHFIKPKSFSIKILDSTALRGEEHVESSRLCSELSFRLRNES